MHTPSPLHPGDILEAKWLNAVRDLASAKDYGSSYVAGERDGFHAARNNFSPIWFPFYVELAPGATIPPSSLVVRDRFVRQSTTKLLKCAKPSEDNVGDTSLITWPRQTAAGSDGRAIGLCTLATVIPTTVACSATFKAGDTVGPVAGSWQAGKGKEYVCFENSDGGYVKVVRVGTPPPISGMLRKGVLVTDLYRGGWCKIREYTYDHLGRLCIMEEEYDAHDPLNELEGTGGMSCCLFQLDPADPLGRMEIVRITCPLFDCRLCDEGQS